MSLFSLPEQNRDDDLIKKLQESAKKKRTRAETKAQRISWVLSAYENPDEKTIAEVEKLVEEMGL
ncbi:MAG: hypothetical protein OXE94_15600 [Aestuariivita sp.]|nr:hypothetical protein [Aestuariivita sp.]MCY4201398.1 hypothetical protein [Aestuariivita sp.]MCY4290054.1 hypothetical protein [Aestuariivita sp.]MCY4346839.1 hypothetical protein [Aestuariivita sp.]